MRAAGRMRGRSEGCGALQVEMGEVVLGLVRAGRGHGNLDPAHAHSHLGTDLQELEPDGAAGRAGELGVAEPDPAQRVEEDVGEGREPEPKLIGAHSGRRGTVGEQVELLLLDNEMDASR